MAQATAVLRHEHEAVGHMLDAAEAVAGRLERNEPVRPEVLEGIQEFFALFVDQCHHGKEEEILFPALARRGVPVEGGPIGVMLHEHEEGRELAAQLRSFAGAYARGEAGAGTAWARAARRYAHLLAEHILKENSVLFPLAEGILSPEEQNALGAEFDRLELEKMGEGTHERLHARMAQLLKELAATAAAR